MDTMVARFSDCAVVTHWLPHTLVQIFFRLILVQKKVWFSLSSLSIQTRVLVVTFCITLLSTNFSSTKHSQITQSLTTRSFECLLNKFLYEILRKLLE